MPLDSKASLQRFFTIHELLEAPDLARFYTDVLVHSPTTITVTSERQGLPKRTSNEYAHTLAELGIAEELDSSEDGTPLWRANPVSGQWTSDGTVKLGPAIIAVYGATSVDDNLYRFMDRHGRAALMPAILATLEYLKGEATRRGVSEMLDVPAVEGIAVSQAIEPILVVVKEYDALLNNIDFEVDTHPRTVELGPY
ncbi:DUF7437 domain-containing protein [Candidatus Halobonum tyrrellensis]|uniref:DUF7437 domain-containing protein n=1 Tax=Candidatus Halobonum tyrrellensis TaxID=1431545 RepID=UPI0006780760|nr:hypothetical protein [Candidatus Halobonum tyrrellensis]